MFASWTCCYSRECRARDFSPVGLQSFGFTPSCSKLLLVHIFNNKYDLANFSDSRAQLFDDVIPAVSTATAPNYAGSGANGAPLQPLFGNIDLKVYNINFENI
jgi:hypothetical protein